VLARASAPDAQKPEDHGFETPRWPQLKVCEITSLREWLASQGWNDVFLDIDPERGLIAADRWQKALNAAIGRSVT
jgi:hypothetical protein